MELIIIAKCRTRPCMRHTPLGYKTTWLFVRLIHSLLHTSPANNFLSYGLVCTMQALN